MHPCNDEESKTLKPTLSVLVDILNILNIDDEEQIEKIVSVLESARVFIYVDTHDRKVLQPYKFHHHRTTYNREGGYIVMGFRENPEP